MPADEAAIGAAKSLSRIGESTTVVNNEDGVPRSFLSTATQRVTQYVLSSSHKLCDEAPTQRLDNLPVVVARGLIQDAHETKDNDPVDEELA